METKTINIPIEVDTSAVDQLIEKLKEASAFLDELTSKLRPIISHQKKRREVRNGKNSKDRESDNS